MTCREIEPLLNARLDEELDATGLSEVDRHLADCRVCAGQYAALEKLHHEIAAVDLRYVAPATLEQKIEEGLPRQDPAKERIGNSRFPIGWWRAAAVAAALVAGILAFHYAPRMGDSEMSEVGQEILDSHLRSLQVEHPVDVASSDQHTVKPWFQGKTSFSPPTPDLSKEGFDLVGGRLEVLRQQPAAAIVYKRRQHVISLYIAPSNDATIGIESQDVHGYHLLHWSQAGINYWAVSDVSPEDLRIFANLIRGGR